MSFYAEASGDSSRNPVAGLTHGVTLFVRSSGAKLRLSHGKIYVPVELKQENVVQLKSDESPQCVFFDEEQRRWSGVGLRFLRFGNGKSLADFPAPRCFICVRVVHFGRRYR